MKGSQHSVRSASDQDADALMPLISAFCSADGHPFDEALVRRALTPLLAPGGPGLVLAAEEDGELVGYAVVTWGYSLESGGRDALLDEIHSARPGRGIGTTLVDAVVRTAREHGATRVFLETERGNQGARRFYQRSGFVEEDSIWMSKEL